jgi:hypothetical protein
MHMRHVSQDGDTSSPSCFVDSTQHGVTVSGMGMNGSVRRGVDNKPPAMMKMMRTVRSLLVKK